MNLMLDPSLLYYTDFRNRLLRLKEGLKPQLYLPSAVSVLLESESPKTDELHSEFGKYSSRNALAAFEDLLWLAHGFDVSYYSVREHHENLPVAIDLEEYGFGSLSKKVLLDQLGFLFTHSTVWSRLKIREQRLYETLRSHLTQRLDIGHITVDALDHVVDRGRSSGLLEHGGWFIGAALGLSGMEQLLEGAFPGWPFLAFGAGAARQGLIVSLRGS